MSSVFRRDPALTLPASTVAVAALEGPSGVLALEGPAEDRPFALAGERAVVLGRERDGPREVIVHLTDHSVRIAGAITLQVREMYGSGGAGRPRGASDRRGHGAGSIRISPFALRRTLHGDVAETVFQPPAFPGAVVQWARGAASMAVHPPLLELILSWNVPARATTWRYLQQGPFLALAADRSSTEEQVLFVLTGDPLASWTVQEPWHQPGGEPEWERRGQSPEGRGSASSETPDESHLRVGVRLQLPVGATVQLALLAGTGSALGDALAMLRHLPALERRAHAERDDAGGLHLGATGPADLAGALARAEAGLERCRVRPPTGSERVVATLTDPRGSFARIEGGGAASAGLAALTSGRFDLAGLLLTHLQRDAERGRHRILHLLMAAEYGLWTGDLERLEQERAVLETSVKAFAAGPLTASGGLPAALTLLADAVEPLGHRRWVEHLRDLVGMIATSPPSSPPRAAGENPAAGGIRLPVLRPPTAPSSVGDEASWIEWPGRSAFLRGDADTGAGRWRARLGSAGHAPGPAASGRFFDSPGAAADAILPFVLGILGARPDAHYGRLRLAPLPPSDWGDFSASNLRIGDAAVTLAYRKKGRRHTFTLRQTAGRAPIDLVFEPAVVPRERGVTVRIADEIVDVDTFERGTRLGIRLQLPLDQERRVTIEEGHVVAS